MPRATAVSRKEQWSDWSSGRHLLARVRQNGCWSDGLPLGRGHGQPYLQPAYARALDLRKSKLSCILLAEVLVGPDLFVSCVLASMADSDLGRILAPLPLELLPCAVVAFRESSAADFDAVLRNLLAAGPFGHLAADLTQAAAAALHVRLTHAAAAGWLPVSACRPDAAWLRALPSLLVPLNADAFPFMLAAFFSRDAREFQPSTACSTCFT